MLLKSVNLDVSEKGFQSVNPVNGRIDKSSLVSFNDIPTEVIMMMSGEDKRRVDKIMKEQ